MISAHLWVCEATVASTLICRWSKAFNNVTVKIPLIICLIEQQCSGKCCCHDSTRPTVLHFSLCNKLLPPAGRYCFAARHDMDLWACPSVCLFSAKWPYLLQLKTNMVHMQRPIDCRITCDLERSKGQGHWGENRDNTRIVFGRNFADLLWVNNKLCKFQGAGMPSVPRTIGLPFCQMWDAVIFKNDVLCTFIILLPTFVSYLSTQCLEWDNVP